MIEELMKTAQLKKPFAFHAHLGKLYNYYRPLISECPNRSREIVARSAERSEARSAGYSVQTGRQWEPVRLCVVVCCLSPFLGPPDFGTPLVQIPRQFAAKTCRHHRPLGGPTFGTRDSQISKGSRNQKVF